MRLKVLIPSRVLVDEEATKVVAEAANGSFCLRPRHIDFVAALVPGILSFTGPGESETRYVAVDSGILVKCGDDVIVSTRGAVADSPLGELRQTIRNQFKVLDEREKMTRSALARLEANFVRRFMELEK